MSGDEGISEASDTGIENLPKVYHCLENFSTTKANAIMINPRENQVIWRETDSPRE